jgi:hypothetical protein
MSLRGWGAAQIEDAECHHSIKTGKFSCNGFSYQRDTAFHGSQSARLGGSQGKICKRLCFALHEEHDAVAPQSVQANFRETLHFEALAAKK